MYANGFGVAQDDVQALKWYGKAAEQGHALAQFNLGGMYGSGRGVKRDALRSFMWLTLAADAGDVAAASNRKKVALDMTPEAIAEAQELARRWRAQHRRVVPLRERPR
jgi:TPR repeat protein